MIDEKPKYVTVGDVYENIYADDELRRVIVKNICLHSHGYYWIEVVCVNGELTGINYSTFVLNYKKIA